MAQKITLACSNCKTKNYRVDKSSQFRLTIRKFCKKCTFHTWHKEDK